mmetsp:Transcript_7322/g.19008  ORF Transcript_7322/g.19008 Transcript_7322/m.19008 type:complete len:108 (+) Transcript_7322:134-457(+)
MHDMDIVHGDLTTSNVLVEKGGKKDGNDMPERYIFIDFGLSVVSTVPEDKAVDLYVMERAIVSTHPNSEKFTEAVLKAYCGVSKKASAVIQRLGVVRARGRKRDMIG